MCASAYGKSESAMLTPMDVMPEVFELEQAGQCSNLRFVGSTVLAVVCFPTCVLQWKIQAISSLACWHSLSSGLFWIRCVTIRNRIAIATNGEIARRSSTPMNVANNGCLMVELYHSPQPILNLEMKSPAQVL